MTDREGPRAVVTLTCDGCKHSVRDKSDEFAVGNWRCSVDQRIGPMDAWQMPGKKCPFHPVGQVIATEVPNSAKVRSDGTTSDYIRKGFNICRRAVIESARKLGQEVKR